MKNILNYMYMDKNYFINNLDRAIKEEWINDKGDDLSG